MTAADVAARHEVTGVLSTEAVKLTATDGETYLSKFGSISNVLVNSRARTGAYASVSGTTVTIHCTSASDDTVDLLIIGKP